MVAGNAAQEAEHRKIDEVGDGSWLFAHSCAADFNGATLMAMPFFGAKDVPGSGFQKLVLRDGV